MIHSESERQFYLGAAGIRLWYAREALPGAAASPEFDFSDEDQAPEAPWGIDQPEVTGAQRTSSRPGPDRSPDRARSSGSARVANLQALMGEAATGTAQPSSQAAPTADNDALEGPEPASPTADAEPVQPAGLVPRLELQIWQGGRFAIVAHLSSEASLRLQETLAGNILKSLGEAELDSVGPMRWPVFNNVKAPGNSMSDLRAVLGQVLTGLGERRLIVLGVRPPEEFSVDEPWFSHLSGARPAVDFPHSLAELATRPELKRTLWQELKPLASQ